MTNQADVDNLDSARVARSIAVDGTNSNSCLAKKTLCNQPFSSRNTSRKCIPVQQQGRGIERFVAPGNSSEVEVTLKNKYIVVVAL